MSNGFRKGQRLPDELLLMILDHFSRDQKTLKSLLLVSRFFFTATLPLLYSSLPILGNSSDVEQQKSQDKVLELLIASVIHSQRHLSSTSTSDTSDRAFSAADFLERFGLDFIEPVTSVLLQDAIQGTSPTTIDYVQYWTRLPKSIYENAEQTLCAFDLPIDEQETIPAYQKIDEWDEREEVDCHCNRYGVRQRLYLLFLQLYPEQVTAVEFCVCKAHWYLHLADTLPNLITLTLSRRQCYYIPDTHLENTIAFIAKNRAAFPERRPLQLEFTSEWADWMAPGAASDPASWYEWRELDRQYQLPRTVLYKAIGNPVEMDVSHCPDFYEDVGDGIAVDALEKLVDVSRDRFEYGESPYQEAFLARCKNLVSLEIRTDHDGFFSWAVNKLGTFKLDQQPETSFSKLRELTLHADKKYREIEDAITVFGRTVETFRILDDGYYEEDDDDELEDLPIHVIVGNWNLPCVRVIEISAYCSMGDFSECGQLEVLKLHLYRARPLEPLRDGDDSQDPVSIAIAPVWNMSHLKTLELHGMAALCFNYDTLDHVPRLESLSMDSTHAPGPVDSIQRLSHYNRQLRLPGSSDNSPLVGGEPWKNQWSMPMLQSLDLRGVPSSVFCFNWLPGCPSLKSLVLDTRNVTRRLPLLSSSQSSAILPDLPPYSQTHEYTFDEDLESEALLEPKPLLYSKLEILSLRGNWVMSREAFARALAVYAPNLSVLQVDRVNLVPPSNKPSWHGGWLIRAVYRAEEIMKGWRQDHPTVQGGGSEATPTSKPECFPERKLLIVESKYRLIDDALNDLGLTQPPAHVLKRCQETGKQVFSMCRQRYVRKEDVR
ncbi:hypothetical protein BGZ74_006633 [Mortierella antarctica]|nr:hypothetical protein BGZ74_006633 [Mortierella antarctica]